MVIADPGRESPLLMRVQGQLLGVGRDSVFCSRTPEQGGDFLSLDKDPT